MAELVGNMVANSLPEPGIVTVEVLGSLYCIIFILFYSFAFYIMKSLNRIKNIVHIVTSYIGRKGKTK